MSATKERLPPRIRLGVSACLAGEKTRYDGGDKRQPYLSEVLARHFELVPVCPEMAVGLGVPREPIQLEGDPARPRAVGVADRRLDATARLERFGRRTARELRDVSGFLLKARSPSCGLEVKVHGARGATGRGLFARQITDALPLLPVVDEGCLESPEARDHFLERVFAYRRWQTLQAGGITAARLVEFHAAHKLMLLAHSPGRSRALGHLMAEAGAGSRALAARYGMEFMAILDIPATPRKHANVLQHLMGYLKRAIDGGDKEELLAAIEQVRTERAPLAVPLTLLRHHFRRHPHPYVARQWYLYPNETEALLRCL